jgi:hypothetical protein
MIQGIKNWIDPKTELQITDDTTDISRPKNLQDLSHDSDFPMRKYKPNMLTFSLQKESS